MLEPEFLINIAHIIFLRSWKDYLKTQWLKNSSCCWIPNPRTFNHLSLSRMKYISDVIGYYNLKPKGLTRSHNDDSYLYCASWRIDNNTNDMFIVDRKIKMNRGGEGGFDIRA